jgi:hypothetical protein
VSVTRQDSERERARRLYDRWHQKQAEMKMKKAEAQRKAPVVLPVLDESEWEEEVEGDWEEEFEEEGQEQDKVGAGSRRLPGHSGDADAGAPSTHNTRGESTMSTSKSNTSTSTDNATVIEPEKPGVVAALGTWTKRAAAAGVEGAKDGAAFAAAEVLTMTLISGLSIEFPFLLIAYRSSAVAQKIMQILVPYLIGAAATVGLLPKADDIIPLCERALRAAISANVGPIMRRFEGPIMEAISQAGKTMGPRSRGDRPDRADQSDENWK